jgi:hypothetical protein
VGPAIAALLALAGCGDGPTGSAPVCGEAPILVPGAVVEGELGPGDERLDGSYIDYYSVQVSDSATVVLEMTSAALDPFVYLFDEARQVRAQAFDTVAAGAETARLEAVVGAGCWLIGASSWNADGTGAYALTARVGDPSP